MSIYLLKTDGGSRGNPGPAAYSCVIYKESEVIYCDAKYMQNATNNVAEYNGLLLGLEYCSRKKLAQIEIQMDSELIVQQLLGKYQVKDEKMKELFTKVKKLLEKFEGYKISHIPREENKLADRLVNLILDSQI
ncbi:ribonuclease HI family protein [bacterium]|nr:MAG: ribonuclease HI family protein [bacterium]